MALMRRVQRKATWQVYSSLEGAFRKLERAHYSRSAVLEMIPPPQFRGGGLGTITYGEWAYMIGALQTLIYPHLPEKRPVRMLDVGCGVGRLYLAAKPYLRDGGSYHGIDVGKDFIDICKAHYDEPNVAFTHTEASNAYYAATVSGGPKAWPIADGANNLVTALSVWTHLREDDWRFYLHEVSRVLSAGGRAIITFFILDDLYRPEEKTDAESAYYPQPMKKWVFSEYADGSPEWFTTPWANVPEAAIAVSHDTFKREVADAGLKITHYYPGQWKDQPGLMFQDVVVFEKA